MTSFANHKIELDLDEALATFDCVAGVLYQDTEDENVLLMPHFTTAKCFIVDCTPYDKETRETTGDYYPYRTERLGEPVEYMC